MPGPKATLAMSCLLLAVAVDSAAQRPPMQAYTTVQGLASNRVLRVVRDPRGFLWFCTAGGLSRFDGTRITTYDPDNGLPFTTINDLLITRSGQYLLASNGVGIIQFRVTSPDPQDAGRSDPRQTARSKGTEAWRFRPWRVSTQAPANRVNVLLEDRQGQLWAGTDGGLFVARTWQEPPTFVRVPVLEPARDWQVQVWALAEDPDGSLWIGSTAGLARRLPDGRIVSYRWTGFRTAPGIPLGGAAREAANANVWALVRDRAGRLWIGHSAGLTVIAPEPASVAVAPGVITITLPTHDEGNPSEPVTLPARPGDTRSWTFGFDAVPTPVMALALGRDGHVWMSGRNRVAEFDGRDFQSYSVPMLLAIDDVSGIVEDEDGHIWTGSLAHGAMRFVRSGFMTFSDVFGSIVEIEDGTLCAYRPSALSGCFDGARFVAAPSDRPQAQTPVQSTRAMLRDQTGAWWMGAQSGLYQFPPGRQFFDLSRTPPLRVYTARDGLATDDVSSLFEDSRGDIWIGTFRTHRQVLTRRDRATGQLHHYSDADGLPPFCAAAAFAEDRSGAIWIRFREGHVARYRDGRFTLFRQSPDGPPIVTAFIHVDRRGRLWLGRDGGLLRVDHPETGRLDGTRYTTTEGLGSNLVNAVVEDRWGYIYVATSRGVDRLDPITNRFWHYTEADGLAGDEVKTAFCDRYGAVWFSGSAGLSRFVPRPERPGRPPDVAIGAAVTEDREVPLSALGDTSVDLGTLPGALRLRIDFFGSTFGVGQIRYRYKLEGADEAWSAPTSQQSVRYERLAPRRYRFLVHAINAEGMASPRAAAVSFRVLPPIWQRWWVLLIGGSLAALAMRAGVRRRIARLVAIERLRTRLATDLHDEIGANLSQIAVLSEVLRQRAGSADPEIPDRLGRIADVSRESLAAMSDIVWAIDPQRDSATDLVHRMRRFANDVLTAREIAVRFSADAERLPIVLDADFRRDVFLIFKEAVHNVVRHADATEAEIELRFERHELSLRVRDNGKGLNVPPEHDGLGLRSMRERARRLGGQLDLASMNGRGASITLTVPLKRPRRTGRSPQPGDAAGDAARDPAGGPPGGTGTPGVTA